MKILVTGGAGYIGTKLIKWLVQNSEIDKIVVYDNLSRGNFNLFLGEKLANLGKLQFLKGDILDSRKLRAVLKDIDIVYHLAAKVSTPLSDQHQHLFEQVNHWGTAETVYAVEESNISKFIYLSSVSIYGFGIEIFDINSPPNPKTFYSISKFRGEEHVSRLSHIKPTYIIRCGNVYGYSKSMRFDAVINRFMFESNFTGRISIDGNGQQRRAFVHVDRVAQCLKNLLFSELLPGTYNLVDKNLAIIEIANTIKEIIPHLEMLFINQHLKLREINVKPDPRLNTLIVDKPCSLYDELVEFKEQFAF